MAYLFVTRYRSLNGDGLSPLGVPSSQMESLIDASQTFPVVEISTSKPMPRSVVIEEDINGQKVPIVSCEMRSVTLSAISFKQLRCRSNNFLRYSSENDPKRSTANSDEND